MTHHKNISLEEKICTQRKNLIFQPVFLCFELFTFHSLTFHQIEINAVIFETKLYYAQRTHDNCILKLLFRKKRDEEYRYIIYEYQLNCAFK